MPFCDWPFCLQGRVHIVGWMTGWTTGCHWIFIQLDPWVSKIFNVNHWCCCWWWNFCGSCWRYCCYCCCCYWGCAVLIINLLLVCWPFCIVAGGYTSVAFEKALRYVISFSFGFILRLNLILDRFIYFIFCLFCVCVLCFYWSKDAVVYQYRTFPSGYYTIYPIFRTTWVDVHT